MRLCVGEIVGVQEIGDELYKFYKHLMRRSELPFWGQRHLLSQILGVLLSRNHEGLTLVSPEYVSSGDCPAI
jgi:hypothetical protein